MKQIRNSLFIKLLLLVLSFSSGFISAYESYQLIQYHENYSSTDTLEQTSAFSQLYLKYIQRVCVYVKQREAGFVTDPMSIYSSSDLVSVLSGNAEGNLRPSNSVYEFTQDSFEYYNRLLNIDTKNFFYYVKNLDTNEIFYSPHFKQLLNIDSELTSEILEDYLKGITKKPAYLMLTTNNSLYSTNISSDSFYSSNNSDITWCLTFLSQYFPSIHTNMENFREEVILEASTQTNNYMVYTFFDPDFSNEKDEFTNLSNSFNEAYDKYQFALIACPISLFACLLFAIIFLCCAGHKKGVDGIVLNFFDRWYMEASILLSCLLFIPSFFVIRIFAILFERNLLLLYLWIYTNAYLFLAVIFTTIVKRAKRHCFFSSIAFVQLIKKMFYIIHGWNQTIKINLRATIYMLLVLICFGIAQFFCYLIFKGEPFLYMLILRLLILSLASYFLKFFVDITKVIKNTREIVDGNLNATIPSNNLTPPINQLANDINNIRTGFSKAVDDQIKSERLKTELITNVSHDIKTPLTSIINYVDLLNKQNLPDETSQKYLKILTEKSWRLKTLIEDLVEASKASAGAIIMHPDKLNYVELVKQSIGEYEDRLQEHHLEPILQAESDELYIYADGRSTFRVIENLFSNVCKYALNNTRVYIRLESNDSFIKLEVMNISASKLGMRSDELMERFVRGDISRNSEGSGLGLSIANSLTALQGGSFELKIDGDLFKAIVSLPLWKGNKKRSCE